MTWVVELSAPDHRLHRGFKQVKDEVVGACATSFGVREEVQTSGIPLLTEYKGHQSLRERGWSRATRQSPLAPPSVRRGRGVYRFRPLYPWRLTLPYEELPLFHLAYLPLTS